MRSGEDITDIISKRGITREEVDGLNPDVNLDRLSGELSAPACQLDIDLLHCSIPTPSPDHL